MKAIAVFTKSLGPKNSEIAGIDHCGPPAIEVAFESGHGGTVNVVVVGDQAGHTDLGSPI